MNTPDPVQMMRLFRKVTPGRFIRELCEKCGHPFREEVYTPLVVMWLMIWQRLDSGRSLAASVQQLVWGEARELLSECKRQQEISGATGGYCQARQKLPKLIASEVTDRIVNELRVEMQEGWSGLQRPVLMMDGSSLQLPAKAALQKAFPAGNNQHGENHWPVMRIVVIHDVYSGLAQRPSWGPMYGEAAVSEQALAGQALARLPADAVVLSDCNFGIFAFAYQVQQGQRDMILRLTPSRAHRVLGRELSVGTDCKVVWRGSGWERKVHPEIPKSACVEGRLIVCAHPVRPNEVLCLFTTIDLPSAEILSTYKLRWNVEIDLRSLKQTLGLHQLSSKSVDMVEKELLLAITAYNLIRAVMCLAARRANLAPRQLSFSFVRTVVEAALPTLARASSEAEYQQVLDRILRHAARGKHPHRSHARFYPREVWSHGGHFPARRRPIKNAGQTQ